MHFDKEKFAEKAELLKVLGHPVRLCIVAGLLEHRCNVTRMQECLNLPQSTVSQHLAVLKANGVIKGERNGLEICYRVINPDAERIVRLFMESKGESDESKGEADEEQ